MLKSVFAISVLCLFALMTEQGRAETPSVEVLSESLEIELADDAKTAEHRHQTSFVIHHLDALAEEARYIVLGEGSISTITEAEVKVERNGKTITKKSLGDFEKMALSDDIIFINQDRQRVLALEAFKVGDLVRIKYKIEVKPFLGFSVYTFFPGANTSRYQVSLPTKLTPKYAVFNGAADPLEEISGGRTVWTWEVTALEELPTEDYSPALIDLYPSISIGVDRIAWGPAATWETLADTYWERAQERLSRVEHHDLKPREQGASAPLDRALELTQNNLRYTAIYFGLDGYIPHDPNEILRRRYGDCKDMATLIWATTPPEVASINLAAVATRDVAGLTVDPLPTMHFFNHMVAHAETAGNGEWLDATASYATVDNPRSDIQGSPAMIASGSSRGYARIPVQGPESNQVRRSFRVVENQDRVWSIDARLHYLGTYAQFLIETVDRGSDFQPVIESALEEAGFQPLEEWPEAAFIIVSPDETILSCQATIKDPTEGKAGDFRLPWETEPHPWSLFRDRKRKTDVEWPFLETRSDSLYIETPWHTFVDLADTTWSVSAEGLSLNVSSQKSLNSISLVRTYSIDELRFPVSQWRQGRALRQKFQRWSSREVFQ